MVGGSGHAQDQPSLGMAKSHQQTQPALARAHWWWFFSHEEILGRGRGSRATKSQQEPASTGVPMYMGSA
jgi:hypothetical protein